MLRQILHLFLNGRLLAHGAIDRLDWARPSALSADVGHGESSRAVAHNALADLSQAFDTSRMFRAMALSTRSTGGTFSGQRVGPWR